VIILFVSNLLSGNDVYDGGRGVTEIFSSSISTFFGATA